MVELLHSTFNMIAVSFSVCPNIDSVCPNIELVHMHES